MSAQNCQPFNPCTLVEDEQIPAKIWELLRRNERFRASVEQLRKLDNKERATYAASGKYHGPAWKKSCALIRKIEPVHSFAHVAFMWLVPEPLLTIVRLTVARNGRSIRKQLCALRPHHLDAPEKTWPWRSEESHLGWPTVRGPRDKSPHKQQAEVLRPSHLSQRMARLETRSPDVRLRHSLAEDPGRLPSPVHVSLAEPL